MSLEFDAEKYLTRIKDETLNIQDSDFNETDKELIELVKKTGKLNDIRFQVSSGKVVTDRNDSENA